MKNRVLGIEYLVVFTPIRSFRPPPSGKQDRKCNLAIQTRLFFGGFFHGRSPMGKGVGCTTFVLPMPGCGEIHAGLSCFLSLRRPSIMRKSSPMLKSCPPIPPYKMDFRSTHASSRMSGSFGIPSRELPGNSDNCNNWCYISRGIPIYARCEVPNRHDRVSSTIE